MLKKFLSHKVIFLLLLIASASVFDFNLYAASKTTPKATQLDYVPNKYVTPEVWERLKPYFLPYDHPAREKLDRIFSKHRAIQDLKSMRKAGFINPFPRQWTRVIVTKHPRLPGYLIKAYLDKQHYHQKRPEYDYWVMRIKGAQLIQQEIDNRQLQGIFKTPKKWIYPVPEEPSPPAEYIRKNFILVVEDMNIYDEMYNRILWSKHEVVTRDNLAILFRFVSDLGLWDCTKPDNIPIGLDGKIAFIDTQSYHRWPVKYHSLAPFLNPEMQAYWNSLQ